MIGIMNVGEESVEFFGAARHSSLFDNRKTSRDYRTYMPDGRVMVNGIPVAPESADNLWKNLIHKAVAKNMVDNTVEKPGRLASIFRRLSSKINSFSRNRQEKKETEEVVELADEDEAFHITRIRVHTKPPTKENPQEVEDRTISNKVLKDKEAFKKNQWPFNNNGTDSGLKSVYETPMQNHRVIIAVEHV